MTFHLHLLFCFVLYLSLSLKNYVKVVEIKERRHREGLILRFLYFNAGTASVV